MNYQELVEAVAGNSGAQTAATKRIIDQMITTIMGELIEGREVRLVNFGKFAVKNTASRTARNPVTGGMINVPAKKRIVFSVFPSVKAGLNK